MTWIKIPGVEKYLINPEGDVMRVTGGKGAKAGKILKPYLSGQIIYTEDGEVIKDYRQKAVTLNGKLRYINRLLAESFKIAKPIRERKIVVGSKNKVRLEKTKMIVEKIDPNGRSVVNNLRWNFVKRGERHPNHKLTNEAVHLIRSNLRMKVNDFIGQYGDIVGNVSLNTVRSVFNGKSWRVRTKPLKDMTYPSDNYPGGKFSDRINY